MFLNSYQYFWHISNRFIRYHWNVVTRTHCLICIYSQVKFYFPKVLELWLIWYGCSNGGKFNIQIQINFYIQWISFIQRHFYIQRHFNIQRHFSIQRHFNIQRYFYIQRHFYIQRLLYIQRHFYIQTLFIFRDFFIFRVIFMFTEISLCTESFSNNSYFKNVKKLLSGTAMLESFWATLAGFSANLFAPASGKRNSTVDVISRNFQNFKNSQRWRL